MLRTNFGNVHAVTDVVDFSCDGSYAALLPGKGRNDQSSILKLARAVNALRGGLEDESSGTKNYLCILSLKDKKTHSSDASDRSDLKEIE